MERAGQFGIILDDVSIVRGMASRAVLLCDWADLCVACVP